MSAATPGGGESSGRSGLAGSAALMFSGTLVSRLLAVLRNVLLVAAIGVNVAAADAFAVANKLPNIIYMLVAGGVLNAILVPQIVRAMAGKDRGEAYVNRLLTMAAAALLVLTLLLTAGSSVLVTIYASQFDPQWFALAVTFAWWCIPQLFFYGMYTLLGQVLNARGNFGPYMWAPAANNVVAILGLAAYLVIFGSAATGAPADPAAWTGARVAVLAGGTTLGVAVQAVILVVPLRRSGFRYRPSWGLRGSGLGRASSIGMWVFGMILIAQFGLIAISNLSSAASGAGNSANSAWENANFLYILPQSLITVSLVTVLFTRVSSRAAAGDLLAVRADLSLGLRTIGVFTVFVGGAFAVLALPLVQTVLPTATPAEVEGIARIVVALLSGIAALGMLTMVQRVYYAFEDARSLFFLQLPLTGIVIVGVLLSWLLLPPQWWLVGAGAATALSNVVGAVVAYLGLRRKLPSLDGARVLRTHLRLVLATVPAVGVGWLVLTWWGPAATAAGLVPRFAGSLGRVVLVGGLMGVIYLWLLRRLRVSELDVLLAPVGRALAAVARRVPGGGPLARVGARWAAADPRTMAMDTAEGRKRAGGGGELDEHAAANLTRGTVLAGRYRLEEQRDTHLVEATAWDARDEILDRPVHALVLPGTSPHTADALDAARRAALVADHRLQRVLAVGTHEGRGYVVSDQITGQPLAEILRNAPIDPGQARALVGEAAGALEAAREQGVHHLALEPQSIVVAPDGRVVIAGLGIDAAYRGLGEPDPLSGSRTDTVALAGLLHTLLTGAVADATAAEDTSTGGADGEASGDLLEVCRQILHTDAGPHSPRELIRELAPWPDVDVAALSVPVSDVPVSDTTASDIAAAAVATGAVTVSTEAPAGPAFSTSSPSTSSPSTSSPSASSPEEGPGEDVAPAPPTPVLDPSTWRPRTLAASFSPAPRFDDVLAGTGAAATLPFTAHHGRGSVSTAVATAAFGGAAALTGRALRTGARQTGRAVAAVPATARRRRAERAEAIAERQRLAERDVEIAGQAAPSADEVPPAASTPSAPAPAGAGPYDEAVSPAAPRSAPTQFAYPESAPPQQVPTLPAGPTRRGRFDPTPVVLAIFVLAVAIVTVLAFRTLTAEPEPRSDRTPPPTSESTVEEPTASEEPAGDDDPESEPEPEDTADEEEPEVTTIPQIASLRPLDPEGDGAENPDLTPRALDGDRSTYWRSRSYVDPQYGMKTGIGLSVEFAEESLLSTVVIDLMGNGGWVEIRDTTADDPTGGELLGEGEMGPESTFELPETVTDEIVLWFTRLPVADSDGRNRLEIAELEVG